ncbi:PREDICTED: uncharacterized protein LOC106811582 isoform X2 [Priapulus caudatus]|uniref:Uncharacterized protein LOC106811582 isoform X2 n=1 Tax=Priapulus caudatus TaxID=37621 RepID=A0ABM1EEY3_PRICU|nr:PREDICTED: uncharacterized protein LOC106811582 isoform X2 [Priapulus caudatus]
MEEPASEDKIILTPIKKGQKSTTLVMERTKKLADTSKVLHVGGGAHHGIVINRDVTKDSGSVEVAPHDLQLQFKVFLQDTAKHETLLTQEQRILRFWYVPDMSEAEQMIDTHEFFKELIRPDEFPKDYVGFIKKIMKMMQQRYVKIRKIECEMTQLEDLVEPPPNSPIDGLDQVETMVFTRAPPEGTPPPEPISDPAEDGTEVIGEVHMAMPLTEQRLLDLIEEAYPNAIHLTDIERALYGTDEKYRELLSILQDRNVIRQLDNESWIRVVTYDADIQVVTNMPKVAAEEQPTVAIITARYCEKVAVDAMMKNQKTYVKYKTEVGSEANIYTLGEIGHRRVVSTKLPAVGLRRTAMIAAGNMTTRLLGTFQHIEYVFLVGAIGGVPHFTDHRKHLRRGDVVVSVPTKPHTPMYIYCENERPDQAAGCTDWETQTWSPSELRIQMVAEALKLQAETNPIDCRWLRYLSEGLKSVRGQETNFKQPSLSEDKLYMIIGSGEMVEVEHPEVPSTSAAAGDHERHLPAIHLGQIASGSSVFNNDVTRHTFAATAGVVAFDEDFDSVIEATYGSRIDNYAFVKGVADYADGSQGKAWQPYASMVAAAFMKDIVQRLPHAVDTEV